MNQNEKPSANAHRIKSLNQLLIPQNKSKDSPINYNFRRRNSQNTYNFSINKPLSPLSSHSSFLIPSGSGKHNGDTSETFIKSKLSRESFKKDDLKLSPPLRVNTEKSFFFREDGHTSSNQINKRSNSLNSNSASVKNDPSGYNNYNNMKTPIHYNSLDNNSSISNNLIDDNNSEASILNQGIHKSPRSFEVVSLGIPKQNHKTTPTSQSSNSTPYLSHSHYINQARTPTQTEKKPPLLLSSEYNTYSDNPSDNTLKIQKYSPTSTHLAGWVLLFFTYCIFVIGMYSVVFSRFMADTGNQVLDGIKNDRYYCYLIPLLIVVIYLFIFINWFSMKLFRHN